LTNAAAPVDFASNTIFTLLAICFLSGLLASTFPLWDGYALGSLLTGEL